MWTPATREHYRRRTPRYQTDLTDAEWHVIEASTMQVTTVGIDLAKSVFQVHGIDAAGKVVLRKALRRSQMLPFFAGLAPCLIGMEACSSAHHWARELSTFGHRVNPLP